MSLNAANRAFADCSLLSVSGYEILGLHRLVFRLQLAVKAVEAGVDACLVDLGGDLMVKGKDTSPKTLGRARSLQGPMEVHGESSARNRDEQLFIDLTRGQLEGLEEMRAGGGLSFDMSLWARLFINGKFYATHDQPRTLNVNQGTWVELLAPLGYERLILIEVPASVERRPGSGQVAAHLLGAQQAIARGEYREAVGRCRDVLEALGLLLQDEDEKDTKFQGFFDGSRSMSKAERARLVRRALKTLTHPANHVDEMTSTFNCNRTDAYSIVAMVAALVRQSDGAS